MDTRCTVCTHASRPEIDQALIDGLPLRPLAAQYNLSSSALSRHLKHLRQAIAAHGDREYPARRPPSWTNWTSRRSASIASSARPKTSTPSTSPSAVSRRPSAS